MGTKSLNSHNLLCSDRLDHSGKQLKLTFNPEEDNPVGWNQTDVVPFGLDSPDVQAGCYITLWVGITVAWTLACIYGVVGPHNARVDL